MVNQPRLSTSAKTGGSKAHRRLFFLAAALGSPFAFSSSEALAAGPLRKGPYLQDITPDSASIRLEVDPVAAVDVEVLSPSGDKLRGNLVLPPGASTGRVEAFQTFRIGGLTPSTSYRFRVLRGRDELDTGTFSTAPAATDGRPVSFVVYGDNRSDDAAHEAVARAVAKAPGDFLVHTGDFVEDGNNEIEWQRFFEIERSVLKARCLFGAVGNHELVQPSGEAFLRYFGDGSLPSESPQDRRRFFRSVRWGAARFLFLNAMDTFVSTAERTWLTAELARAAAEPGVAFRFVVLHHGPFSAGPHGQNPRLFQSGVVDLLREHKVDLIFSGHDHIYERGEAKGLKYLVTGGGGAPLYPIRKRHAGVRAVESAYHHLEATLEGQRVSIVARRVDGSVLDRCGFSKGGSWDCDAPAAPKDAPSAPAPVAPPAPAPRCGCVVPGGPTPSAGAVPVVLALSIAAAGRRRLRAGDAESRARSAL